ncbi:MAG: penicillin-binding protein 1A [Myxococcota bacterium]
MAFFRSGGIRIALVMLVVGTAGAAIGGLGIYLWLVRDLPDFHSLDDYDPPVVSEVYDRNGHLIGEFYTEKRRLVPIDEIPRHVQLAFVAAEDGAFFEHEGIDLVAIARAAINNLLAQRITGGASTITQQMVKGLLLSPERTYTRKMKEIILSRQIEQNFTKDEILYLYLNQIYFGGGAYGVGQAARTYFGKDAQSLTVSEAALLAGLVQRPSAYDPRRNFEAADNRRRYVIGRMLDDGHITREIYDREIDLTPVIQRHPDLENFGIAGHFTEEVRRLLFERLEGDLVLNAGLRIETTLDIELQRAASDAVREGLIAHDRRRGYRGPVRQIDLAAEGALAAELERLARENEDEYTQTEVLPAVSADAPVAVAVEVAEADEAPAKPEPQIAYSMDEGAKLLGIVVEVDAEAKIARIELGRGIVGVASLDDVDWAKKPDPKKRPRAVKEITSIFRVGDVARFLRIPGDAAQMGSRTTDPAQAVEDALAAPEDLARLDLWQEPEAEGALLSMENETGDVIAMIGGYDFERSEFNRAVQAQRQPGSAFKPFIYGAALTRGFTPVSTLIDRPVVYTDPISGFVWAPRNYGRKFYGPMTMRDALKKSVNNATVHLFRDLGVRYVIDYARRFGIQAPLSSDLSLALGSSSMTLLELTRAYAVYPRGGTRVIPRFIRSVTDAEGHTLLGDVPLGEIPPPVLRTLAGPNQEPATESYPDSEILPTMQIITPADAYLMSDLLHAVVLEGTGRRLKALGRTVAGKTGTTNDFTDAWFMGFSPELTTGVWVGHDDNQVLGWGESGGKTALPIWGDFMRVALTPYPQRDFEVPAHIEFQRIDRSSGLIADANTTDAYFQPFLEGTAPERSFTEQTTTKKTRRAARDDIF